MSEMIGRTLGPYRILEQLGMGGMATVYKAYQANMDRNVAVKVLPRHFAADPTFVGRFEQEAKVIAKLENARILPVYDYGEEDGITYIVMRYLDAGTLSERIRSGPIPFDEDARIISQIAEGLDYAHKKGVIHRDIKPSNIMLDQNGDVYITDFGISKLVEGTAQFTGSGIVGTPDYVSPEQALGQPIDYRSDIYSLGIVLYQMATRDVPFHAETPMAVIIKHINDPLPLPRSLNPDIPATIENVILKALAKQPDDRFQSCGEMATALRKAVEGAPVPDPMATKLSDSTAPLRPSPATMGAGTMPLAAGAAAASAPTEVARPAEAPARKKRSWLVPVLIGGGLVVLVVFGLIVLGAIRRAREANQVPTPTNVVGVAAAQVTPTVVAAAALPNPTGQGGQPAQPAPGGAFFGDDFNADQLRPEWQQLNIPSPAMKLGDGHLVLAVLPGTRLVDVNNRRATLDAPALLIPVPAEIGEYAIQVDVAVQPTHNFQGAGLLMATQPPNAQRQVPLFALMRAFCDNQARCQGDAIYLDSMAAFALDPTGYRAKVAGAGQLPQGVVTLRLIQFHGKVVGQYSIDKQTWHNVGEWPLPPEKVRLVGLVTNSGGQPGDPIPAIFDNFVAGPPPGQ